MTTPRKAFRVTAIGVAFLVAGGLSSCSGCSTVTPSARATGPLEEFFSGLAAGFEDVDQNALMIESEEVIASCMADLGFEYTPVDYSAQVAPAEDLTSEPDEQWGTLEFAKKHGYGATTNPGGGELVEPDSVTSASTDPNSAYAEAMSESESEQQAYQAALSGERAFDAGESSDAGEGVATEYDWTTAGCQGKAQHEVFEGAYGADDSAFTALQEDMTAMYEAQAQDLRVTALNSTGAACMDDGGYPGFAAVDDAQNSIYDKLSGLWDDAHSDIDPENATEAEYAAIDEMVTKAQAAITEEEPSKS